MAAKGASKGKRKPSRTLLIDGDIFIFKSCLLAESVVQWDTWTWGKWGNLSEAAADFDSQVSRLLEELSADQIVVALTDGNNWRKSVLPTYKHNRVTTEKPVLYGALRQYVAETYQTYIRPGLEGDDVLGILSTNPKLFPGEKIIVSCDKDMQTIPGLLVNDMKAREAIEDGEGFDYSDFVYEVTTEEADHYHLLQTLTGDATDGYAGCPGYGPVTAKKLLGGGQVLEPVEKVLASGPRKGETEVRWLPGRVGTPWEIVVSAYASAGLGEEEALVQAQVARICRYEDYNYKTREVKLWQPA